VYLWNFNLLGVATTSEIFLKPDVHFGEHWWQLDQTVIDSRQGSMFTVFPVNVTHVTLAKQACPWKYATRNADTNVGNVCWKIKISLTWVQKAKELWTEATVLQIEPNIIYTKHKESTHMSLLVNPPINWVWTHLLSGSLSSARRLESYNTADFNVLWHCFTSVLHMVDFLIFVYVVYLLLACTLYTSHHTPLGSLSSWSPLLWF
jgi:hypothetical protein